MPESDGGRCRKAMEEGAGKRCSEYASDTLVLVSLKEHELKLHFRNFSSKLCHNQLRSSRGITYFSLHLSTRIVTLSAPFVYFAKRLGTKTVESAWS